MQIDWTPDQVILVIDRAELGQVKPEIVDAVWDAAMADEKVGRAVGNFFVLQLAILCQGVLQFIGE